MLRSVTTGMLVMWDRGFHDFDMVAEDQSEQLYQRLLRDIARRPLPERRNRVNPCVVKQNTSKLLRKRRKHYQWPQPGISFRGALVVI